ncbi:DUF4214 domain-containing protein [Iamia sp. SCSIO 61187]|uniref:DUF4214 domain-containing protein n=1 Tax=Iamia sp. SCSIO 61187 TaxID=2722752 RepID=UPI001C62A907|nr:DUF4214 domain-containing protein [Iamia sp. SCSIO 61187]QYG92107.1 DUF4214 domain-containing protein [Iamia sp. SCSIO 61187]
MHTEDAAPTRRRAAGVVALGLALVLALAVGPLAGPSGAVDRPAEQVTTLDPPPVVCPAEEGNARFVRFIYLNILFRCPEQSGLEYWTRRLDAGYSRGQFAKFVDLSQENLVHNNVVELYRSLLERDPTEAELAAGVDHIRRFQADGQLIADILASDEFYAAFAVDPESERTKDEQWLDQMYQFILDREVDPGALEFWIGRMGDPSTQASRQRVTRYLERAPEATIGWIFGVYFAGLNRPPSDSDIAFWQDWLLGPVGKWRTFHMWTSVLASSEGYARAQTQPSPEQLTATPEGRVAKQDVTG